MKRSTSTKLVVFVAALAAFGYQHFSSGDTPDPTSSGDLGEKLDELTIQPENTDYDYDRDEWPHWSSVGNGCNTRDMVLLEQENLTPGEGCEIPDATWTSEFDDEIVSDPSKLDIDHVVPLAEVARSGAHDWSEDDREKFANDRRFLMAVTAASNREKGDQDPADWMPSNHSFHCEYVEIWIDAKHVYDLSVDQAEYDAISSVLGSCEQG